MLRINVYLMNVGDSKPTLVNNEDIKRAGMTIIANEDRRDNALKHIVDMIDDGVEIIDSNKNDVSWSRLLKRFMPRNKEDGTIQIIIPDNTADTDLSMRTYDSNDHVVLHDMRVDIMVKYTLGSIMFCETIIFDIEDLTDMGECLSKDENNNDNWKSNIIPPEPEDEKSEPACDPGL